MTTVAVLGLGTMGGPMAANIARAGFTTRAWNRTSDRPGIETATDGGAEVTTDPRSAVAGADVVLTCVSDDAALNEVFFDQGVADALSDVAVVVDTSTIGPGAATALAERLPVGFLDAPVSGGDVGARNGTLTVMVGGAAADLDRARPVLVAIGSTVRHCGPVGAGQALKMCNQVLCGLHAQALSEALTLADRLAIDKELVTEVCGTGAAGSWALEHLGAAISADDFEPGFAVAHMLKDLRLALAEAERTGADLPGTAWVADRYAETADRFGGDRGTQALYLTYGDE